MSKRCRVTGNTRINKKTVQTAMFIVLVSLLYFLVYSYSFATLSFSVDDFKDISFWTNYALVIGVGLILFSLLMIMRKDIQKKMRKITDELEAIAAYRVAIIGYGLYDAFSLHLKARNKSRRLEKYRNWLIKKRHKAKKQKNIDKYNKLYLETLNPSFDIDNIKVTIKPITPNVIFSGFTEQAEEGSVFYSGFENIARWLWPVIIVSVFFAAIGLSATINFAKPTIDQWKNLIILVILTLGFCFAGDSYGTYSVDTVFYSVLQNRKSEIKMFLKEQGKICEIFENPTYKYAVELKDSEEGKNGG
jgi:hypothetical protein